MEPHHGPIRWGIWATGRIADAFAEAFPLVGPDADARIVAVGSRRADTAAAFAAAHGIDRAHGSRRALADDPDVDVVYVASLHPDHVNATTTFLEAGKHVLCEKPLALNAAEADRMIGAARANDRFLMEALWTRFNPVHVAAYDRLDKGAIGEIRRIRADFSFALPPGSDDHRLLAREKGGGSLLDLGIYPMTLAWWALGEPERIEHVGRLAVTGVDDEMAMLCSWPDGAVALLTCSVAINGSMTAVIEGTEGVLEFAAPGHASASATLRRGGEVEELSGEPASLHHQVIEVHRCLRDGLTESPRMPWATSRAVLARFDAIRAELGVAYPGEESD